MLPSVNSVALGKIEKSTEWSQSLRLGYNQKLCTLCDSNLKSALKDCYLNSDGTFPDLHVYFAGIAVKLFSRNINFSVDFFTRIVEVVSQYTTSELK